MRVTTTAPAVKRKTSPKKTQKKSKVQDQRKSRQLLRQIEESIAKIESKTDNFVPRNEVELPKTVDFSLPFEEGEGDVIYQDILVRHLKENLRLPGFGKVTLKLSLQKNGGVTNIEVIQTESDKNRNYLSDSLKTLSFPPFQGDLDDFDEQTFLITFHCD